MFGIFCIGKEFYMKLKNENDNFEKVNGKQKNSNQMASTETVKSVKNSKRKYKLPNLENENNSHKIINEEHKESNQLYFKKEEEEANNQIYNTKVESIRGTKYCEFLDIESVEKWVNNLYGQWYDNLIKMQSILEATAPFQGSFCSYLNGNVTMVEAYAGSAYENINRVLRGEETEDNHFNKSLASKLALEILLAPKLDKNIIVYRFINKETFEKIKNEITNSGSYIEKGFLSTTLLIDKIDKRFEYYNNHNFILKIYVNKDSIGVYNFFNLTLKEYEMIFLNNGVLKEKCASSTIKNNILECVYENN